MTWIWRRCNLISPGLKPLTASAGASIRLRKFYPVKIETTVKRLWVELAAAIDKAGHSDLYDYSQSRDHRALDKLLAEETANERGHRSFVGGSYPVSNSIGAKITLLSNIYRGAIMQDEPLARLFLTIRPSAAEAITIGYILRADLSREWLEWAEGLDYSAIMDSKQ